VTRQTGDRPVAADQHRKVAPGLWNAVKEAAGSWMAHKSPKAGASLAYYSVFSMGPLIVVVISIATLIFDRGAVQREVTESLTGLLGAKGADAVNGMLTAAGKPSEGVFAAVIGTVTLVFAALGVVIQLKEALNTVWEVKAERRSGIWGFVRDYVLSLAGVAALGFMLLVSMLLAAGLAAAGRAMGGMLPEAVMQVLNFVVSFAVISALFALLFKWMPDADVAWRDVVPGAIGTAALFEIGRFAIGFYIGKQGLESTYGASASIVVVLIWVYYSAQIVLFGAEFTRVQASQHARERGP
jgi:membrane protein